MWPGWVPVVWTGICVLLGPLAWDPKKRGAARTAAAAAARRLSEGLVVSLFGAGRQHRDLSLEEIGYAQAWAIWCKALGLAKQEKMSYLGALLASVMVTLCQILQPVMQGRALDIGAEIVAAGGFNHTQSAPAASSRGDVLAGDVNSTAGWMEGSQILGGWFGDGSQQRLAAVLGGMAAVEVVHSGAAFVREKLTNNIGDRTRQRAQNCFFASALRAEVGYFDRTHTSQLNDHYARLNNLHYLTGHQIPSMLQALISLGCSCAYMLAVDAALGGLLLAVLLVQGLVERCVENQLHTAWVHLNRCEAEASELRMESFTNIRTIKHFSVEDRQAARMHHVLAEDEGLRGRVVDLHAARFGLTAALTGATKLLTWCWGLWRALQAPGGTSLGAVAALVALVTTVREAANQILKLGQRTMETTRELQGAFRVMERAAAFHYRAGEVLARPCRGHLQLQGVTFRYPTRPDVAVLRALSLTAQPNQVTALCGPSGGGKSTVASLVLRDYDPCEGAVLLDGADLRTLSLQAVHRAMAVVSQEPMLFASTVWDNITFATEAGRAAALEQVHAAARMANAHDFIQAFKDGYHTQVGERGVRLSGGQKQRVAIARAILTNPQILILDEATSALDASSEQVVQEALDRVMVGRTTLVIAHRLSTIQSADNIIVIEGGRVAEQGTHAALMEQCGVYERLVERQQRNSSDSRTGSMQRGLSGLDPDNE